MKDKKMCPMTGKYCTEMCAWMLNAASDVHPTCAISVIGNSLGSLMMSLTGEWGDEPATRIADAAENIADGLVELEQTIKNIDFTM